MILLTFMTIQLDYGLQISQFFSSVGSLALTFHFVDQLALVSGGRPRHTLNVLGTRSTRLCLEKPLDKLDCCLSAEKHARMVLATEAREGPNTQDGTEHLTAVSRPLFEGMTATFHPTLYSGEVARLFRMMAYSTGSSNKRGLVILCFSSHPAYSSCTRPPTLACHCLVQDRNSDVIAEHHVFC